MIATNRIRWLRYEKGSREEANHTGRDSMIVAYHGILFVLQQWHEEIVPPEAGDSSVRQVQGEWRDVPMEYA